MARYQYNQLHLSYSEHTLCGLNWQLRVHIGVSLEMFYCLFMNISPYDFRSIDGDITCNCSSSVWYIEMFIAEKNQLLVQIYHKFIINSLIFNNRAKLFHCFCVSFTESGQCDTLKMCQTWNKYYRSESKCIQTIWKWNTYALILVTSGLLL